MPEKNRNLLDQEHFSAFIVINFPLTIDFREKMWYNILVLRRGMRKYRYYVMFRRVARLRR